MKKKENNNLVVLKYEDGERRYFTSLSRAGKVVGLASASVLWAIHHQNVLVDNSDRKLTIGVIDGSEIKYKNINNE